VKKDPDFLKGRKLLVWVFFVEKVHERRYYRSVDLGLVPSPDALPVGPLRAVDWGPFLASAQAPPGDDAPGKKETAKAPTSGPPAPPRLNPSVLAQWDKRLREKVRADIAAGERLRFGYGALRRAHVNELDGGDRVHLASQGVSMAVEWESLSLEERAALALACASERPDPGAEALAAFYLMAAGDEPGARSHLARAGGEAARVREAFAAQ
jgi:hypothetical protein